MAKLPSIRVPSDDCTVEHQGQTYQPHEGESVWVWPNRSLSLYSQLVELNGLKARLDALAGEPDEQAESLRIVQAAFAGLAAVLAPSLERWDWTDQRGAPMPPLDGTPGPLLGLHLEELQWLVGAVRGETDATRKNASKPSRTGS